MVKTGKWSAHKNTKSTIYVGKSVQMFRIFASNTNGSFKIYADGKFVASIAGSQSVDIEGKKIQIMGVNMSFAKGDYEFIA